MVPVTTDTGGCRDLSVAAETIGRGPGGGTEGSSRLQTTRKGERLLDRGSSVVLGPPSETERVRSPGPE